MLQKTRALLAGLFFSATSLAQIADKTPNIIPQSPQNAALFKYTESPVSYYNGSASSNIPVYEINVGNYKLPISLSYHSGGIKVNEEATWVGLGWALNAGGVVSENVVGKRDAEDAITADYMKYNIMPNRPLGRNGQPLNVIERGVCFPDYNGVMRNYLHTNQMNNSATYLAGSDRQYDLFTYNFNGFSGKLINPKLNYYEDKFVSLDNNNIQFSLTGTSDFKGGTFKAITPDGVVYIFDEMEHGLTYNGTGSPVHSYSRHLTSITTPEGRTINFIYKTVNTILVPSASHSYYSRSVTNSPLQWIESKTIAAAMNMSMLYLDQITWDNGSVKFISDNVREDIYAGLKLNSIQVYNNSNVLVKKADFTYDYFTGDMKYGDYFTQSYFQHSTYGQSGLISETARKKRLKLLSVKIDDMSPYKFEYKSGDLPYKTAFARDMWDYFNGVNFDQITLPNTTLQYRKYSLLPNPQYIGYYDASITPLLSTLPGIPFGQRQPDENAMQMALLEKITYPTGGSTVYEYEANRFAAPDGVSYSVNFSGYTRVMDGNVSNDIKQAEFVIPTVNQNTTINNGKIDIRLSCSCTDAIGNGLCWPYTAAQGSGLALYGLYVSLEHLNGSTWEMIKVWDFSESTVVNSHGILNVSYNFLQGHTYRITANYPDRTECDGDYYGNQVASIQATYYQVVQNSNTTSIGGGIRIKKITDYESGSQVALTRNFTYENGVLMTKPLFMRFVTHAPMTYRANSCSNVCHGCDVYGELVQKYLPGTNIPVDPMFFSGYYSEPTVPYSYGANGSLVGYGKVTEEYIGQKSNGKTEYVYHNNKDVLLNEGEASYFYSDDYKPYMNVDVSKVPGIPTIKNPLNGKLKTKTLFKREGNEFVMLQRSTFGYRLDNTKKYWGYKTELSQSGIMVAMNYCNFAVPPLSNDYGTCLEMAGTNLYFYPVTCVNVNLISQAEEYFDDNNTLVTTTDLVYNTKNQLQKLTVTDSKGHQITKETYYVPDRQSEGAVVQEMQNRNMLDYPVEQISNNLTLNKELSKTKTNFSFWNGTSQIFPGTILSSLSGNTLQTVITYNAYDNKGNILQYTTKDGVPECFVWGYKQTYPIAKITGATYGQVLAALAQSDQNLAYLQSHNDAGLEVELNKLRNNLASSVPKAKVNTFLYIPLVGIKQAADENNKRSFYEYDTHGRLIVIKDQHGHVIKTFEYKYRIN